MKNKLVYVPIFSLVMAIVTGAFALPSTVLAATYTVNTTDDTDDGTCDARHCSLREALRLAANHAGFDEIRFNIPGSGPHVITPIRFLQDIDGPCVTHSGMTYDTWWTNCFGDITIDGTSEPGYAGVPMIVLDGSRLEGGREVEDGRIIVGSHSTVRGISFVGWRTEVLDLEGDHITIEDNYIGVDPSGTAHGNYLGIRVHLENTIIRHNVISGNECGILQYSNSIPYVGTIIEGNYIGTDPSGTVAIGNEVGIQIQNPTGIRRRELFSSNAVIGGGPDERNIISGNGVGIQIETDGNRILGNYIGTDITGGTALPNGIGILVSGSQNYIGEHNLISGNVYGLRIAGGDQTLVYHNNFGTDAGGSMPVPNQDAIDLFRTTVADISTNVIAYSTGNGIDVRGTSQSFIAYNEIYQNRNIGIMVRDDSVPSTEITIRENAIYNNGSDGIFVFESSQSDIIRNVIQDNGGDGIRLGHPGWEGFSTKIDISMNSIFRNSGLGIRLTTPEDNQGMDAPVITGATLYSADGTACPNCRVEIFLSDADSSGSGEGKQYLGGAYSHADGTFHAYLPRLRSCDQLTATATDELGNTSEFSRNYSVSLCWRIPPLAAWIWILGAAGAGVGLALLIVFRARRLRRQPGPVSTIALGLVGGLLGAGIAIGLLSLPFISIQWPQGQPGAQAPASGPSCGQFVNENLLQPPNGAVFEPGTDMLFELSPQPDPPGMQTRWFIEITGPGNQSVSKELTDVSISLSDLGFDPDRTGFYFWSLRGERSQTGSNKWDPLCTNSVRRMFRIATPQSVLYAETEMAAPNENEIPTPTLTPTLSAPAATLLQIANCRRGPNAEYDIVSNLPQGLTAPIVGRNPDSSWWKVQVPGTQTLCWVFGENVEPSGDTGQVPIVEAEPLGCWVDQPQGPDKCVAPCPQGAKPGGACEP